MYGYIYITYRWAIFQHMSIMFFILALSLELFHVYQWGFATTLSLLIAPASYYMAPNRHVHTNDTNGGKVKPANFLVVLYKDCFTGYQRWRVINSDHFCSIKCYHQDIITGGGRWMADRRGHPDIAKTNKWGSQILQKSIGVHFGPKWKEK